MHRILLVLALVYIFKIDAVRRRCINNGITFSEKILRSPVVIYGETISKQTYRESSKELLSNVTFRVDCILKGQDIENQINITEAGIKLGHMSCQWLDPGHFYIVFLETWGINKNTYRPVDFQELVLNDNTKELLAKTCRLKRLRPLNSLNDNCPNVSAPGYCPHDNIDMNIAPRERSSNYQNPFVKSSYFDQEDQFYLQSNVTYPKSGLANASVVMRSENKASSVRIFWFILSNLVLLLIFDRK